MKIGGKTALLSVDLQKLLTLPGGDNYYPTAGEMMKTTPGLIDELRSLGVHIVHIYTQYHTSSGVTASAKMVNPEMAGRVIKMPPEGLELDDRVHIEQGDTVLRKFSYSAFLGTPLLEILEQKGISNILVSGIKTNVCCRCTAVDAASRGFRTYMISDMTCTNNDEIKAYHLDEINRYFAKVITSSEVIERLKAGEL